MKSNKDSVHHNIKYTSQDKKDVRLSHNKANLFFDRLKHSNLTMSWETDQSSGADVPIAAANWCFRYFYWACSSVQGMASTLETRDFC
jgi:transposase